MNFNEYKNVKQTIENTASLLRQKYDKTQMYPVVSMKTSIVQSNGLTIWIEGNTLDPEFWIVIRNELVKQECQKGNMNDDYQMDDVAVFLQKDLLDEKKTGGVRLCLVTSEQIDEQWNLGRKARGRGYLPMFWDWCHDIFTFKEGCY